jgi:hypothetical protein
MHALRKAAFCALLLASFVLSSAQGQDAVTASEGAKAQLQAINALAEKDPELANHFGLFRSKARMPGNSGKLVAAANILSSIAGKRVTPESLNELASKEKLYSENVYGASVVLDQKAFCRLLSLGSGGRFAVSLEHRVEGRKPDEEAQEAEASSDLFVILAYLDHMPMIETRFAWSPDGHIARVSVVNPLAASGAGAVVYKAKTDYDPAAFDAWEFYRFRKSIR